MPHHVNLGGRRMTAVARRGRPPATMLGAADRLPRIVRKAEQPDSPGIDHFRGLARSERACIGALRQRGNDAEVATNVVDELDHLCKVIRRMNELVGYAGL